MPSAGIQAAWGILPPGGILARRVNPDTWANPTTWGILPPRVSLLPRANPAAIWGNQTICHHLEESYHLVKFLDTTYPQVNYASIVI
jgi:hypothetical protein